MRDDAVEQALGNRDGSHAEKPTKTNIQAAVVFGVSMIVSLIIPQLLRFENFGMGCSLLVALIVGVALCLNSSFHKTVSASTQVILLLTVCLSATFTLRSSNALMSFSCVGLVFASALLLSSRYSLGYCSVSISSWLFTPILTLKYSLISSFRLLRLCKLHRFFAIGDTSQLRAVALGLLFAVPFLYIFGALLTSSDARFDYFIRSIFEWDFGGGTEHLIKSVLYWPFVVACVFSAVKRSRFRAPVVGGSLKMNGVQLTVMLSCLNLLFVSYICVQFSYFFGGDQLVASTQGLTYASYAKGGFWELVWVALIALPLLVMAHWLQREESAKVGRWFLLLSSLMIFAIIILEFSAVHRMVLYIQAYGLTQLRFYASAFMVFIIIALIGFYLTVLKGERGAYVATLSGTAIAIILILNLINPSALIASYNLNQAESARLDVNYILSLGADAYPAVIKYKTLHPDSSDCRLKQRMNNRLQAPKSWVEWNYAVQRALNDVNAWQPSQGCSKKSATG